MKDMIPFKGAVRKVTYKKCKVIKRGKLKCDCGMWECYPKFTSIPEWHLPDCIINTLVKKKKSRRK